MSSMMIKRLATGAAGLTLYIVFSIAKKHQPAGLFASHGRLSRAGLVCLALTWGALTLSTTRAVAGNENWSADFSLPGINGRAWRSIEDSAGNLYIRGEFTSIAGTRANHIAKWDGTSWSALGRGVDGYNSDMALDSQGNVYVIHEPPGTYVGTVARWNGSTWSSLNSGVEDTSNFQSIMIGSDDKLYAGGDFSTADGDRFYAAAWDGSAWTPLGDGLSDPVWSMVTTASGELLAAVGNYNDGMVIRKLTGNSWADFEYPLSGRITDMVIGPDGALYVGARWYLHNSNNTAYRGVARWSEDDVTCIADGTISGCSTGWTHLGTGVDFWGPYGGVYDLAFDQSGTLYAGGRLRTPYEPNQQIVQWDGNAWSELATGTTGDAVHTISILNNGNVLAGGNFSLVDSAGQLENLAVYDGSKWSGFDASANRSTQGLDGEVTDMVSDGAGNVYVTGFFNHAGSVETNYIAHWDGQGWNALGAGLGAAAEVLALDSDGNLYAAGYEQQGVLIWNGASWSLINLGEISFISDMTVDDTGNILIGGYFSIPGGQTKTQIARWDGNSWDSYLDEIRIDNTAIANEVRVNHMALGKNGSLYVSGPIIDPTGPYPPTGGIAKWDENRWEVLDANPDFNSVGSMAVALDESLFAYASVQSADGSLDDAIWQWDGNVWSLVVDISDSDRVSSLATSEAGELFAGFDYANGSVVKRWDGTAWADMGTGIENGRVNALAFAQPETLFVAGSFDTAGGKLSNNIANFTLSSITVDTDGDGLLDHIEIALGLSPFKVDTDGDGVDDGDEDTDGDSATNLQEIQAGTDPGIDPETAQLDVPVLLNLVEITSQNSTVEEGEDIIVTIERSGDVNKAASVSYELSGTLGGDVFVQAQLQDSASLFDFFVGRAVANVVASGTLDWPAGDASPRQLRISIMQDEIPEGAETIELRLVNTSAGAATVNSVVSFTIYDQPPASVPGILLPDQQWRLISVPAMAGGQSTLRDVFADDIVLPYNDSASTASWVVYEYLSHLEVPIYRALELDDELKPGVGYWIIHAAGETVEIDLPSTTLASIVTQNDDCSGINGCFERQLHADETGGQRWQILGNPFYRGSTVGDMRVVSNASGECADGSGGCTLAEAMDASIINDTLWSYNGEQYQIIDSAGTIEPWQGCWSATIENAYATQPKLLIPNQ